MTLLTKTDRKKPRQRQRPRPIVVRNWCRKDLKEFFRKNKVIVQFDMHDLLKCDRVTLLQRKEIRKLRESLGLTRNELAALLNAYPVAIDRCEGKVKRNKKTIGAPTVPNYTLILGILKGIKKFQEENKTE